MGLPRIALEELVNANVIAYSNECVVNENRGYKKENRMWYMRNVDLMSMGAKCGRMVTRFAK